MLEPNSNQSHNNLTGIIIITFPPPDNPSKGKTITAYTISNDEETNTNESSPISAQQTQTQSVPISTQQQQQQQQLFCFRPQLTLLPLICISLIGLFVWVSVNSETRFVLGEPVGSNGEESGRRKNETERERTFVFPLYRKYGGSVLEEGEIKLGRFVGFERRRGRIGDERVVSMSVAAEGIEFG